MNDRATSAADARMSRRAGSAALLLAVVMNVPFGVLAATFDYPDVLRLGADETLSRFRAGGTTLIATWYLYVAVAAAFVPVVCLVDRATETEPLQHGRTSFGLVVGVLAGTLQAVGLSRWVFVVPVLSEHRAALAAEGGDLEAVYVVFDAVHQFGGVAVGEHLGQLAMAAWTFVVARRFVHARGFERALAPSGVAVSLLLVAGLHEAFTTVVPFSSGPFALATPIGFAAWSLWLAALGLVLLRRRGGVSPVRPGHAASGPSSV